jgi:hypothetical protein
MIFNYTSNDFEEWENFKGTTFFRRLEFETAFDGIVKVYSLQTDNDRINELLKGLFFHRFAYQTKSGVLLRQFKDKKSWPKTRLVHLNLDLCNLLVIKKTRSSYDSWTVDNLGEDKLLITLSPNEQIKYENK